MDALTVHRIHFAFTITYHYIFPQLTMGLALLIVILKLLHLIKKDERFNIAARFWTKIFAINFAMGVITGIPMEFQFGTNWAKFSQFAGGVIGQTLAMEGMFAFFLESIFLGLLIFGEKRVGKIGHFLSAIAVWLGSWLSGYFIVATDAWMQNPIGYSVTSDGTVYLQDFWALLINPWALWQYAHTMAGAVVTASFVMASVGAYYLLNQQDIEHAKLFIRIGVITGILFSLLLIFPTGDGQGKLIAEKQPLTLAAMEGLFETKQGAELIIIGQPDITKQQIDNPLYVQKLLSFLTYQRWNAEVKGLNAFPHDCWPDNIPLLYYSYHIMVGLGTIFIAILFVSLFYLLIKKLFETRWILWILMLSFPFPYIANTAGWMTAELGRQPWLVYGLMRTANGISTNVSAGNGIFTLIGFLGMYLLLGILFLFLVIKEINHGPESAKN